MEGMERQFQQESLVKRRYFGARRSCDLSCVILGRWDELMLAPGHRAAVHRQCAQKPKLSAHRLSTQLNSYYCTANLHKNYDKLQVELGVRTFQVPVLV